MTGVHPVIYGMRGWIAFVAFIELSNAIRCFIDEKDFVQKYIFSSELDNDEKVGSVAARLMGQHCLLNGAILIHCAICIQYMPIIVLTIMSLSLSIFFYGSEAFYYYTAPVSFHVIFPILLATVTIVCLLIAPYFLDEEDMRRPRHLVNAKDDNDEEEIDFIPPSHIKQRQAKHVYGTLQAKFKKDQ